MSTHIGEIEGVGAESSPEISLNRFWGGDEKGMMLQITVYEGLERTWVKLTESQVKELVQMLEGVLDREGS